MFSQLKRRVSITPSPFPIPVDGMWLFGALPQHIRHGYDEKSTIAYFRRHIKPATVFIDIGANYGYFTVLAGKLGATVETFEPDKTSFRRTSWNVRLNGLSRKVTLHNTAVSDTSGVATFYIDKPGSGLNSLVPGVLKNAKETRVTIEPYEGYYDFCKIDVEGAELQVLKGLRHKGIVVAEFCPSRLDEMGLGARTFLQEVRTMGWKVYSMDEVELTDQEAINLAALEYRDTINLLLIP
ncbi:MAG: methyltransferase, FkbM family [Candidatus Adlerbacteria bacterium]|nr:methyltransferase, FkbM family [Candidatus Adlerbacteria bacterium]